MVNEVLLKDYINKFTEDVAKNKLSKLEIIKEEEGLHMYKLQILEPQGEMKDSMCVLDDDTQAKAILEYCKMFNIPIEGDTNIDKPGNLKFGIHC